MADQKKWFKVWTSILANANFAEMSLEDIGRWTLLGAAIALDGDHGRLLVPGKGKELCRILRVRDLAEAKRVIDRISTAAWDEQSEQKPSGTNSVRFRNWYTYQEDSRRLEGRRRPPQEEKRGEEKRIDPPNPKPGSDIGSRKDGTNPRARGTNPRSLGTNPRAQGKSGELLQTIRNLEKKLDAETDIQERDRLSALLQIARDNLALSKGGIEWEKR